MRKLRSDRKLNALTSEQSDMLWVWMGQAGVSYSSIRTRVKKEFGLDVSIRALSEWWAARAKEEQGERFIRAAKVANNIGSQAKKLPMLTDALRSTLTQAAFDLALSGADATKIHKFMSIVGGIDRAALDRAKLRLDVDKFQTSVCEHFLDWFADERAREIAESEAPKREKIAQLREAYFADVDAMQAEGEVSLPS